MKCIVKECKNQDHQGRFIDNLCSPCHRYITDGEGTHSQMYRNTVAKQQEAYAHGFQDGVSVGRGK